MGPIGGTVVYLLVWWMVFMCALPFKEQPQVNKVPGTPAGAAENPRIKQKFIISCVIAAVIWVFIYILFEIKIVDFREWAAEMPLT